MKFHEEDWTSTTPGHGAALPGHGAALPGHRVALPGHRAVRVFSPKVVAKLSWARAWAVPERCPWCCHKSEDRSVCGFTASTRTRGLAGRLADYGPLLDAFAAFLVHETL